MRSAMMEKKRNERWGCGCAIFLLQMMTDERGTAGLRRDLNMTREAKLRPRPAFDAVAAVLYARLRD